MGISIASIPAERAKYYTDAIAKDKEEFDSGVGESPPTRFHGRTDGIFEDPEVLPVDEVLEILKIQGNNDRRRNVAFDLTCSVAKSVSVIWAMTDDDTRKTIEKHLRIAAETAIGSMHWYVRTGHGGGKIIEVEGPSNMFDFRHRTNRKFQPQLHSHILVENRALVEDRYMALESREIHFQAKNAGMIFDAIMRRGLTEDLGVAWEQTKEKGSSGDILGVDKGLISHWSLRRQEVEAHLEEWREKFETSRGEEPTPKALRKATQAFVFSTRQAKESTNTSGTTKDLLADWQREGRQFQPNVLANAKTAAAKLARLQQEPREKVRKTLVGSKYVSDPVSALIVAVEKSKHPTLNRWQIEEEARKIVPLNESETVREWNARIETLHGQAVATGELIAIYRPVTGEDSSVGDVSPSLEMTPHQERFATRKHIEIERAVIEALTAKSQSSELAEAVANSAQAAINFGLSEEQAEAVTQLAAAHTVGACLIGAPGSGKTTALGVFAKAAREAGWQVTGLAPTGKAAGEVQDAVSQGKGNSWTIDAWLAQQRERAGVKYNSKLLESWKSKPGPRQLFFLDEVSIASTEQLNYISAYCQASSSKLVIVGDHKQIGSLEKGGILLAIATAKGDYAEQVGLSQIPTASIETVVRQNEEWERRAAEALRQGGNAAADAIYVYAGHGRIHPMTSASQARDEIASRMVEDIALNKESIAIGYTGNAVTELNKAIVGMLVKAELLPLEKLDDFDFRIGQRIITRENIYKYGEMVVRNGEVWKVLGQEGRTKSSARLVVSNLETGVIETLKKDYVTGEMKDGGRKVRGGYATTPITIQSASLKGSSYTLGSKYATSASVLVPMTRGMESNHYFVPLWEVDWKDESLVPESEKFDSYRVAIAWLRAKAREAPLENGKAAIHHIAQAENLAARIKEAERARDAAEQNIISQAQ